MTPVEQADAAIDRALDAIRGNRTADRMMYAASALGDFSVIWHIVNVALVLLGVRTRRQAIRLAVCLGAESIIVNQGIKRLFRRSRPVSGDDHPHHVRSPSTSSFPSGHASSAVVAATLLSDGHPRLAPLFWLLGGTVAASRPYVRAHHASDIVGGFVTGAVLVRLARRIWPH